MSNCVAPETTCGNICVSLATSNEHCGLCDHDCLPQRFNEEATCIAGTCQRQCKPGYVDCFGECRLAGHCAASFCPATATTLNVAWPTNACGCGPNEYPDPNWGCINELRDVRRCGGTPCNAQEWCDAGVCVPLTSYISGFNAATKLLVKGGVHFVIDGPTIKRVPTSGGTPTLVTTGAQPRDLVVDGNTVYFADYLNAGIYAVPTTGGAPQLVASATQPTAISIAGSYVYWAELAYQDSVKRAPLGGGPAEVVPLPPFSYGTTIAQLLHDPLRDEVVFWRAGGLGSTLAQLFSASPINNAVTLRQTGYSYYVSALTNDEVYTFEADFCQQRVFPIVGPSYLLNDLNVCVITSAAATSNYVYGSHDRAHRFSTCAGQYVQLTTTLPGTAVVGVDAQYLYLLSSQGIARIDQ
ncbi:MAG: hypothetical protein R3B72_18305 [Polyangiaceae bacterium]